MSRPIPYELTEAAKLHHPSVIRAMGWILDRLKKKGPMTSNDLHVRWSNDPIMLDAALVVLRDGGDIACTDGLWYRRGE